MIALSPEAYRALMESGQAAADRDALAEAGLDVGPPLPQSLLRLVDDDNVLYAPDPDLERYRDGTLTLRLPALGATWTGIEDGSGELTGTWTQRGTSAALNLTQEVRR
jgi:hypothetical protein